MKALPKASSQHPDPQMPDWLDSLVRIIGIIGRLWFDSYMHKLLFALILSATLAIPATASHGPTYRERLYFALALNWHPKKKCHSPIVLVTIRKDGKLLDRKILESSGNKKCDKEVLKAFDVSLYEPLPSWFKAEQVEVKVDMEKVKEFSASMRPAFSPSK